MEDYRHVAAGFAVGGLAEKQLRRSSTAAVRVRAARLEADPRLTSYDARSFFRASNSSLLISPRA